MSWLRSDDRFRTHPSGSQWFCQRFLPIIVGMGAWTYDSQWLVMDGYDARITYKNMKSLRMRIKPPHGEVVVSAPLSTPDHVIMDFLRERHEWILKHRAEVRSRAAAPESFVTGGRVPLWGWWRELVVEDASRTSARIVGGQVHVRRPANDHEAARRAVDALYEREMGPAVVEELERWEPRIGRQPTQIRLKRMTSRWGSCHPVTGAMSFNVMLAKFRPEALEYVVVHELVHLVERGHGPAFRACMSAHLPDWPERRKLLREAPC